MATEKPKPLPAERIAELRRFADRPPEAHGAPLSDDEFERARTVMVAGWAAERTRARPAADIR